jgi:hypothetical protein
MKKLFAYLLAFGIIYHAQAQTPSAQNSVLVNFGSPTCANSAAPSLSLIGGPLVTSSVLSNCDLTTLFPNFYGIFIAYDPKDNNLYLADINSVPTKVWIVNEGLPGNITCPVLSATPTYTYTNGFVPNNFEFDANGDVWSLRGYNSATGQCTMDKFDEATGTVLFTKTLQFPAGDFPNTIASGDITILPNGRMFVTFGDAPSKLFEITNYTSGATNAVATFLQNMPNACYGIAYLNGDLEITGTDLSSNCYYYKYNIAANTLSAQNSFQNGQAPIDNTSITASIGVAKKITSQAPVNPNTADLTYEIYVKNIGNVTLANINVTDDLGAVYGAANVSNVSTSFLSGGNPAGLTLNPAYNGTTVTNLLNTGQNLVNQTPGVNSYYAIIHIQCRITNLDYITTYKNTAIGSGNIGAGATQINVADSSNDGGASAIDPNNDGNAGESGKNVPTPINFAVLLPVNFISANAVLINSNSVSVRWAVATPAGKNGIFEIEKSSDGSRWNRIGSMQINNEMQSGYEYFDNEANADKIFYRIRETDLDGKSIYSDVIFVNKNGIKASVVVSPNPASNSVNIIYSSNSFDKRSVLDIEDMQGRKILTQHIQGVLTQINTSNLARGSYLFTISNGSEKNTIKVIIIH